MYPQSHRRQQPQSRMQSITQTSTRTQNKNGMASALSLVIMLASTTSSGAIGLLAQVRESQQIRTVPRAGRGCFERQTARSSTTKFACTNARTILAQRIGRQTVANTENIHRRCVSRSANHLQQSLQAVRKMTSRRCHCCHCHRLPSLQLPWSWSKCNHNQALSKRRRCSA